MTVKRIDISEETVADLFYLTTYLHGIAHDFPTKFNVTRALELSERAHERIKAAWDATPNHPSDIKPENES